MKSFLLITLMFAAFLAAGCSRSDRDELLKEGNRNVQEGNYRGAVVLFKSVLEKDPDDLQARYLLADAYLQAGKLDLAEKEFSQVASRDAAFPGLAVRRAELFLQSGRPEETLKLVADLLRTQTPDAVSLALRGRAQLLLGKPETAEPDLREAARLAPDNEELRIALAECLARGGQEAAARDLLEEIVRANQGNPRPYLHLARLENARGNADGALALFRRASELDPDDMYCRYMIGLLLLEKGEMAATGEVADEILRRSPEAARGLQLKGFLLYLQGQHEESASHLQRTAEQSRDPLTFYVLGLNYFRLGKTELALTQFQRILDYRPGAVQPRVVLALTLLQQHRTDEAIAELKKALQFNPEHALAHHVLGSALLAKGSYDGAMEEFDRAIELDPGLAQAHLQKGLFTLARGDVDRGEEYLVQALAVAPEIPNFRLILASHYLRRQKFAEATKTLREGLTGKQSDALIYNYLAAAAIGQKQGNEAIQFLEKAKAAKPDYFTPYYNLASYYASIGDRQKARREFEAILAKDPGEVRAWLMQAQLAEQAGRSDDALACYTRAKETGKTPGVIALSRYLVRRQDPHGALAVLDEALRREAKDVEILEMKGRLLLAGKAYAEALTVARALTEVAPGRGIPLTAEVQFAKGDTGEARRSAEGMVARYPDRPAAYLLLADVQERTGNASQALTTLEAAPPVCRKDRRLSLKRAELLEKGVRYREAATAYAEIVRDHPNLHTAWFALGALHDRLGDKDEAARCYREVLSRQAEFIPALNNLAYLYADLPDRLEEALRLAVKANRAQPANPWVLDTLGYVYLRQGKLADARGALEKAVQQLAEVPSVHYHLALVQHRLGSREQALRSLRSALALGPFPEAERARGLLDQLTAVKANGKGT